MNYESYIRNAIDEGANIDKLAEAITKVKEEQTKKSNEKTDLIFQLSKSTKGVKYSYDTAADLAALTAADQHPEWTAKMIHDYREVIRDNMKSVADVYVADPAQMMKNLFNELDSFFKKA